MCFLLPVEVPPLQFVNDTSVTYYSTWVPAPVIIHVNLPRPCLEQLEKANSQSLKKSSYLPQTKLLDKWSCHYGLTWIWL